VVQIDHLLIHRSRRFHVLETKHFWHGVKVTDEGGFLRWNELDKAWEAMPSPLARNERQAPLLRRALASLGLGDYPIESWVLVAPGARIERPRRFDTSPIIRADQFVERMNKALEHTPALGTIESLLRTGRHDSIADVAHKLVALHRPSTTDYMARFGVAHDALPAVPAAAGIAAAQAAVPADDNRALVHAEECGAGQMGEAAHARERRAEAAAPAWPAAAQATGETVPEPMPPVPPAAPPPSRACGGTALSIRHGRFGYFFGCAGCGGTTPADVGCGNPGHDARLRKDGLHFYRECASCATRALYFTNPE
jgi:hypothetical protein